MRDVPNPEKNITLFDFLSFAGRGSAPPARVLWSQTLRGYIPCHPGALRGFF